MTDIDLQARFSLAEGAGPVPGSGPGLRAEALGRYRGKPLRAVLEAIHNTPVGALLLPSGNYDQWDVVPAMPPPVPVPSFAARMSSASTMVYAYPCSARKRCRCAAYS